MMNIPIVTIIGKSGAGKTTLMEKLVAELKKRGYKLATVKHHSHQGFEIDKPGKDSWRFAQAGSDYIVIASPDKYASYRTLGQELTLDEIAADISDVDLILVEGYKQAEKPALEVVRAANSRELVGAREQRFAVAADFPLDLGRAAIWPGRCASHCQPARNSFSKQVMISYAGVYRRTLKY
jgi:molybdopterin-guanine dinucleotide biosynthesis adapter protein